MPRRDWRDIFLIIAFSCIINEGLFGFEMNKPESELKGKFQMGSEVTSLRKLPPCGFLLIVNNFVLISHNI